MKKSFLFGIMAITLAGLWFGGASLADDSVWDYIYNEASWNAAYNTPDSALSRYYTLNPDEDRWCTDDLGGHYGQSVDKVNGEWPSTCVHSWSGAINATNAKYPRAVVKLPNPFDGKIIFKYDGGAEVYPWGTDVHRTNGYGVASIPEELGMGFLLDGSGNTTFDSTKLVVSTVSSGEWDYIYNEASWNAAYNTPDSALSRYYTLNPDEDRWCTDDLGGHYGQSVDKVNGEWPSTCVHSWSGAINATNAKYPRAVVKLPNPFDGKIIFKYDGGAEVYPWGTDVHRTNGYGVASIPEELGMGFLLNGSGNTTFDSTKLVVTLETVFTKMTYSTYTVTFNTDGGNNIDAGQVTYGGKVTMPAEPTKNCYTFSGWYNGDVLYDFNSVVTSDLTLTAKWKDYSCGGSSSSNGGGGGNPTPTTQTNEETPTDSDTQPEDTPTINPELTDVENQEWYDNAGDQQEVLDNGLTRELNNAYEFAHRAGITTMKSAKDANMNGTLNRVAMAKMLSQYAINVLGKKPDTSKKPNFGDVASNLDKEYNNGVTLAYQLGIMGVGIENFRPYDLVPRSEFVTALSRMLYGLEDGTDKYYSTHMAKLKKEGIITNTNPSMNELRGYVMLMLMRSAMGTEPVNNSSTEGTTSNENIDKPVNESNEEQEVEKYFTEAYRRGQVYGRIGDLQRLLQYLGFYNGDINNTFDNNTIDAVFDFQVAMGILSADDTSASRGSVGPKTREVLNKKWAEYKATK